MPVLPYQYHTSITASLPAAVPARRVHGRLGHYARLTVTTLVAVTLFTTAVQLVYPAGLSVPFARYGGAWVGFRTSSSLSNQFDQFNEQPFSIIASSKTYSQSLSSLGMRVDQNKLAQNLVDFPVQKRLIPFSIFFYRGTTSGAVVEVSDQSALESFANTILDENNKAPVEGALSYRESEVVVEPSVPGVSYNVDDLVSYMSDVDSGNIESAISLPYKQVDPINTDQHLQTLAAQAKRLIDTGYSVTYQKQSYSIAGEVLAVAMDFSANEAGLIRVQLDAKKLGPAIEELADQAFVAPTASIPGTELDVTGTAAAIAEADGETVAAVMKPIPVTDTKVYPATSKGMQSLIDDWVASHDYLGPAVHFSEVEGMRRTAGSTPDEKYFSASVYKVFIAWYLLREVDRGNLKMDSSIVNGWDMPTCMHKMIIISESVCAEASIAKYTSWKGLDDMAAEAGISGISLSNGVAITARGMSEFLTKLDARELMSDTSTTVLLDAMKQQKYRQGIPAGSAGEVADKVGYQPRAYSWHDAAMVYHPKGKYTLVVLTRSGASLTALSTLAKQVSDTLDR